MKNFLLPLSALAVAGMISGCATSSVVKAYPGAERPADQVATIIVPASVEVRSINGAPQPNITGTLLKSTYTIATLPCAQTWSVRYNAPLAGGYYEQSGVATESAWMPLLFNVEPGGRYRLAVEVPGHGVSAREAAQKIQFSVVQESSAPTVAVAASVPVASAPPPFAVQPAAPQTLETAAFEQLKKWWNAAGPSERQSFRDWLKTQP